MRYLFSREGLEALGRAARTRLLVGLDFDGTLAPVVADRDRAAMASPTRAALRRLARVCPCIVISGRSRADVQRRVGGAAVAVIVGNHGLEPSREARRAAAVVRRWRLPIARVAAAYEGVGFEDKRLSLSVHFRAALRKRTARAAVRRAAASLPEVRLVPGKEVLNLVVAGASDKGAALERAWRRLGCESALYVGDDDTDEDVFALAPRPGLLTVRVGARRGSAAQYYLRHQREVAPMLLRLAELAERRRRRAS